jgi:hypothetical protein
MSESGASPTRAEYEALRSENAAMKAELAEIHAELDAVVDADELSELEDLAAAEGVDADLEDLELDDDAPSTGA